MLNDGVQRAGDVVIEQLKLITANNVIFDLNEFLVELNLYEDMFSTFLTGNLVLTDSLNLLDKAEIVGEELLVLKVITPSFNQAIQKTFRVYKVSDRNIVRDNNTQTFVLHFVSVEMIYDVNLPLFLPFEGTIEDIVEKIYTEFIMDSRNYQISQNNTNVQEIEEVTPLYILNETSNKVKFVSPGWSPFKCITWLASKAIPKDHTAKNYLFFETNKSFVFGSVEYIFKKAYENKLSIGTYYISASNIRDGSPKSNINREYFIAKDIEMVDTTDHIKNYTNGYLSNRLITLDVYNKKYEVTDYDYVEEYKKQFHSSGPGSTAIPIFTKDSVRNAATSISFYPVNDKLFNNFSDNVSVKMKEIHGNRKASLLDLTNLRLNITVPGRTDMQVGEVLYFSYPSLGPKSSEDLTLEEEDKKYSGYYLVTAIRHKINSKEHEMVMEIVKDSLTLQGGNAKNI